MLKRKIWLQPQLSLGNSPSSNSMSQTGLGSLEKWPVGWSWCAASAWDDSRTADLRVCEVDREAVVWFRKGFSNAFLMFLTLTWPKPGRLCSWSVVTLEIFAKLWFSINQSVRGVVCLEERQQDDTHWKKFLVSRRPSCWLCWSLSMRCEVSCNNLCRYVLWWDRVVWIRIV